MVQHLIFALWVFSLMQMWIMFLIKCSLEQVRGSTLILLGGQGKTKRVVLDAVTLRFSLGLSGVQRVILMPIGQGGRPVRKIR